jgi:hypothetical protein
MSDRINPEQQELMLNMLLSNTTNGFTGLSPKWRKTARMWGYVETNRFGVSYVSGQRKSSDACHMVERNLKLLGHDVRRDGFNKKSRAACRAQGMYPGTFNSFLHNDYSDFTGDHRVMDDDFLVWFKQYCLNNIKATRTDLQAAVLLFHGVQLSLTSIGNYKKLVGITTQVIQRIAAQRDTPHNLIYAHRFMHKVQEYNHPCWFDETGISRDGMQNRRNKGMGARGAGGAILREVLHYPPTNLSVLAFIDKNGMFGVESFTGGTDTVRVDTYFQRQALSLALRGVDVLILDNCPSHRVHSIALWMSAVGIEVLFLPRYWPQWNPIEVNLSTFVLFFVVDKRCARVLLIVFFVSFI